MTPHLLNTSLIFGYGIEYYLMLFIIAIPVFLFWNWLLVKYIKADRKRIIATWAATIIVTPIVYAALFTLLLYHLFYTPNKDFDKKQWLSDTEKRFQMAADMINSKMLIRKDSNQVKQLIGNPTWVSNGKWRKDTINIWTYDMGIGGGGLGFLFHDLVIKFDKEKVISVEHLEIPD